MTRSVLASSVLVQGLVTVALCALAGCGVETERPPGETTTADLPDVEPVITTTTTEKEPPAPVCTPGESRECKIYWSYGGSSHCITSVQTCRDDGLAWNLCGKRAATP